LRAKLFFGGILLWHNFKKTKILLHLSFKQKRISLLEPFNPMKIGFWNIAGNSSPALQTLVEGFAQENDLDIMVLLECKISETSLLQGLNRDKKSLYFWSRSFVPRNYFKVFTKLEDRFSEVIEEERRIQARRVIDPAYGQFSLILLHYPSKLFWDGSDQIAQTFELKHFIDGVENKTGHDRTVVIGDFNMNPFEQGMVQTTGLHTTMDRRIAELGSRIVQTRSYKFFYNPMWSFYGEKGKGGVNSSYFYSSSSPVTYFWNIFDQVILRPSLLPAFDEDSLQILTQIGSQNLLNKDGVVDTSFSDHLPVIFEIKLNHIHYATSG